MAATPAATITTAIATAVVAVVVIAPDARRPEIAVFVAELGVEGILEAHGHDVVAIRPRSRHVTTTVGGGSATVGGGSATVGHGTAVGGVAGRHQADLALVVDLLDPDLDLVAEGEHVLDGVDPLATRRAWRCARGRRARGGC